MQEPRAPDNGFVRAVKGDILNVRTPRYSIIYFQKVWKCAVHAFFRAFFGIHEKSLTHFTWKQLARLPKIRKSFFLIVFQILEFKCAHEFEKCARPAELQIWKKSMCMWSRAATAKILHSKFHSRQP